LGEVDGYADHLIEGHVGEGEGHVVDAVLDVGNGKASDRVIIWTEGDGILKAIKTRLIPGVRRCANCSRLGD